MQLQLKATNIELTDVIKDYVQKKVNMLDKFVSGHKGGESTIAYVELEKTTDHHRKGNYYRAEIQIGLPYHLVHVEKITSDLYKAIDKVKDEMARQLSRLKDRELTARKMRKE